MATPLPVHSGHITHEMTTTAFTLAGYQIVRDLGVVMGITVRSRSIFGFIGASFETLRGGNIRRFTELCNRARSEAFELMLEHAEQHGANAIVGIRYDATEMAENMTEVLAYGTAVVVEPE